MEKIFDILSDEDREKLNKKSQPDWTSPMLATLSKEHFSKEEWIFEQKFDGERCLVFKNGGKVKLMSRNKKEISDHYPEMVICGYTAPQGSRKHFGALVVGYYDNGKLKDAGKVGTGYDEETLKTVHDKMKALEQDEPPFDEEKPDYKNVTWLKPKLVGEFRFTEWTSDNKLRHPSFLGLREDKKAKNVKKEG